jgi:hypothetical protein
VIASEQGTSQYPDGTVAVDDLNLNVPDGNLTRLVVTRPGEIAPKEEKRS